MSSSKVAAALIVITLLLSGCDLLRSPSEQLGDADSGGQGNTSAQAARATPPMPPDAPSMSDDVSHGHGTDGSGDNRVEQPAKRDSVSDGDAATTPVHHTAVSNLHDDMVKPDVSDGLPTGHRGSAKELVVNVPREHRGSDGTAAFRTVCRFSHMNFDDPIVHPGQPGASHLHAYFGNTAIDAHSTASSIANTGRSTCSGGTLNRTGYWMPAMIDSATGKPIKPESALIYYKSGYHGVASETVQPFPHGLRMVAGNAKSNGSMSSNPHAEWLCYPPNLSGPSDAPEPHIPTDCNGGELLRLRVRFPQCWDGKNLDAADHKSHLAYPPATNGCPKSHPVPLPEITFNVDFKVPSRSAANRWRLASDAYSLDRPGGMSAHSDWFNGWDEATFENVLDNCYRPAEDCNTDNMNDGTGLGWP